MNHNVSAHLLQMVYNRNGSHFVTQHEQAKLMVSVTRECGAQTTLIYWINHFMLLSFGSVLNVAFKGSERMRS